MLFVLFPTVRFSFFVFLVYYSRNKEMFSVHPEMFMDPHTILIMSVLNLGHCPFFASILLEDVDLPPPEDMRGGRPQLSMSR